ncbi:proline racemase family protein [Rhizobium sp. RCAM05973]|uniref:proline racemase family protein n=1 Tax=Rhizobium sp. RCAM05973 TaxID=2994066 RepID=UPI0022EBDABA|nr:proline racemase family protein [Rhizobium sp. RCAM05973]
MSNSLQRLTYRDSYQRVLDVVDSHTCGQPTRVILAGHGLEAGMSPLVARDMLRNERDWVRTVSVMEPRGHRSMFSVALIHPDRPGGEFGVVFMDAAAYPDMCGHATIGTATTLLELGLVQPPTPDFTGMFEFGLQTPAGRVPLRARLEAGHCKSVAFVFEGAYFLKTVDLNLPDIGAVAVDLAYAGQWYAFLPVSAARTTIDVTKIKELIAAASVVRDALAARLCDTGADGQIAPVIGNIVWTDAPSHPQAQHRNVPISAADSFDRSPCGTATCARMATLVAKGKLGFGERFVNEGLVGTIYHGVARPGASKAGQPTIVAEVEGNAWVTAVSTLLVDPSDPLGNGYLA